MRSVGRFMTGVIHLMAGVLFWVGPTGCDRRDPGPVPGESSPGSSHRTSTSRSSSDGATSEEPPFFVGSDSLPEQPRRIVSLAPNITETLFALGVGDRVVGVTKHCDYPPAAESVPAVGSFTNLNFETLLARDPDLVVGNISGGERSVIQRLDSAGLAYGFVRMSTIAETYRGIERVGSLIGRAGRAEELVEEIRRRLHRISRSRGPHDPPSVLLVYGHDPLVAAGRGTFGHELLVRAGAENAVGGFEARYPRLDVEKLIDIDPDRIVDTSMAGGVGEGSHWRSYHMVDAVERGDVARIRDDVVLRAGPRLPEALALMVRAVRGGSADEVEGGAQQ